MTCCLTPRYCRLATRMVDFNRDFFVPMTCPLSEWACSLFPLSRSNSFPYLLSVAFFFSFLSQNFLELFLSFTLTFCLWLRFFYGGMTNRNNKFSRLGIKSLGLLKKLAVFLVFLFWTKSWVRKDQKCIRPSLYKKKDQDNL